MAITNLTEQLLRDEGVILHAYQDSLGFWTIGVGRLIDARKGGGITSEEAQYLLNNDISRVAAELCSHLPLFSTLDLVRQSAITNMAFNLGVPGLLQFHNTLSFLEQKNYTAAADAMRQSKWHTQVGARAERLAEQIATGEWQ